MPEIELPSAYLPAPLARIASSGNSARRSRITCHRSSRGIGAPGAAYTAGRLCQAS